MTTQIGPLHSMTGFGRAEGMLGQLHLQVELKSVNHRFCETRFKLPTEIQALEHLLRQRLKGQVARGRVEVTFRLSGEASTTLPQLNTSIAQHYIDVYKQAQQMWALSETPPSSAWLLAQPGVLQSSQPLPDPALQKQEAFAILDLALQPFLEMRRLEGTHLGQELHQRLDEMEQLFQTIGTRAPLLPAQQFQRLQDRLKRFQLSEDIDEARLHQEVAVWSDRCDISEELTRAASHIKQCRKLLEDGGVIGRRLDFLCQELHREANTIGSKNQDATIAESLIPLKAAIEKLREQVQNLE